MWAVRWNNQSLWITIFIGYLMFSTSESKRYHSILGRFKVAFKRVTECPDGAEDVKEKAALRLHEFKSRTGEAIWVTGNISMPFTLSDESLGARVTLASWSNVAGWKDNAHVFNFKKVCSAVELMAKKMWDSIQMTTVGDTPGCPLLPGIYRFTNLTADMSNLPFKDFIYGRWRADARILTKQGLTAACVRGFLDTVPA